MTAVGIATGRGTDQIASIRIPAVAQEGRAAILWGSDRGTQSGRQPDKPGVNTCHRGL